MFVDGVNFVGNWTAGDPYQVNDTVTHQGQQYRCLLDNTASSSFLADFVTDSKWERFTTGTFYRGGYSDSTEYFKNDLVTTGSAPNLNLYININDHTSNGAAITDATEVANWMVLISGQWQTTSNVALQAFFFGTMN